MLEAGGRVHMGVLDVLSVVAAKVELAQRVV